MPMETFKVGDVVSLKSGGPLMTILNPNTGTGWVVCIWFAGDRQQNGQFHAETLKIASIPKPKVELI